MIRYFKTVLLMGDEFINAICGGYAEETISYRLALSNKRGHPVGCIFCKLIQIIVPNHCDLSKQPKAATLVRPGSNEITGGV